MPLIVSDHCQKHDGDYLGECSLCRQEREKQEREQFRTKLAQSKQNKLKTT